MKTIKEGKIIIGDKIITTGMFVIYGKEVECEILAIHPANTYDVMSLSDGKCFRVSGVVLCE